MAGISAGDEESGYVGNKIQPFSSTPRQGECLPVFPQVFEEWRNNDEKNSSLTVGQLFEEFFSLEVWRASVAELVGTAVLVFALDTIVISSFETQTKAPNLIMAILISLTVTILLLATAPISGGHLNPTITLSATLLGLVSPARAIIYMSAQCVGGIFGALALKAVVSDVIEQSFSLGGCTLTVVAPGPNGPITIGLETGPGLWLEIICTFIFLFASIWMAFDHRQAKSLGAVVVCSVIGIVVGLMVFVSTTVTAHKGYAGAGMNPARCFGPALVRGGLLWHEHWVFWVGPIIASFAFYFYTKIIPTQHLHAHAYKYDLFTTLKVMFGCKSA